MELDINQEQRSQYLNSLDDELLQGGFILSEWCIFIVRQCDIAFVHGANLACILTAVSGIETYLRALSQKIHIPTHPPGARNAVGLDVALLRSAADVAKNPEKAKLCNW